MQVPIAKSDYGGIILAMEEEEKEEIFQAPTQFESRLNRAPSASGPRKYIIIIVCIIVIGLLIFGGIRFLGGSGSQENVPSPTPTIEVFPTDIPQSNVNITPTEEPAKTPTPKPSVNPIDKATGLDRSKLSVHILNGGGVVGASKKASDLLGGLGYNVIQIGNAANFDFENAVIQVKSASSKYLDLLKKDLSTSYSIGTTSADLATDEKADAVITIGKQ